VALQLAPYDVTVNAVAPGAAPMSSWRAAMSQLHLLEGTGSSGTLAARPEPTASPYSTVTVVVAVQLTPEASPLPGLPEQCSRIEQLGYDALWIGEVNYADAVVQASVAALTSRTLRIAPLCNVFTRSPTNAALAAAGLAHLAPGRISIVLGASSPLLVQRWNGIPYERPFARVRDYLEFLRAALNGERVDREFATFRCGGFSLADPPASPPEIFVAAAMARSLRLASRKADGVVLNWLAPEDVDRLDGLPADRTRVWLSMMVCPSPDPAVVDRLLRSLMTDYLSAPAYAGLQRMAGRGPQLAAMWERFAAGDRAGARRALPSAVVEDLVVWGTLEECGRRLGDIERQTGVHPIVTLVLPEGADADAAMRAVAAAATRTGR
jgi:probable F420-dependent oxidoreductase